MATITLQITDDEKGRLTSLSWINWSEVARIEVNKKLIFENYLSSGTLTPEEEKFCTEHDYHPVDNLPLKKEFIDTLHSASKEKTIKVQKISELFK